MDKPNNFEEIFSRESLDWWFSQDYLGFITGFIFQLRVPISTIQGWISILTETTNIGDIALPEHLFKPEAGVEKVQDVLDQVKQQIDAIVTLVELEGDFFRLNFGQEPPELHQRRQQFLVEQFGSEGATQWLAKDPLELIEETAGGMESHVSRVEDWLIILQQANISDNASHEFAGYEKAQRMLATSVQRLKNYVYLSYAYVNHKRGEDHHE